MKKFIYLSLKQMRAHKFTTFFLVGGYLISILLISIGISGLETQKNMILESSEGLTKNTCTLMSNCRNKEIFSDLEKTLNILNEDERLLIKGLNASLDDSEELVQSLTLEHYKNKPNWSYPLLRGRTFTNHEIDFGEKVVLIGNYYSNLIYNSKNEEFIKISGEEYRVIGIIGSQLKNKILNEKIVMPVKSMPEKVKNDEDMTLKVISLSHLQKYPKENALKIKENLSSKITNSKIEFIENEELEQNVQFDLRKSPILFAAIFIYLISIINMINLSFYWVNDRVKEIAIKKAFGIKNKNISKMIYLEFLSLTIVTTILALCIQLILSLVVKEILGISLSLNMYNFIFSVSISILSAGIVAIVPIFKALKIQPIEALKL